MEREVSEVDRKLLLKKNYLDKIRYYLTRNPINQDELYFLVRKFFTEYLKLDYEFTYEELSQELNKVFIKPKVKEHIDIFLIRLSESEYLEETVLGTADINGYLRELDDIIRNVIFDDQPVVEDSPTLIQKVLKRKPTEQDKQMDLSAASAMIDEINYHITNGNIDTAKSSYVELSRLYDKLGKDDKRKIHDNMNEVYERLQTLIKNPKAVTPTIKQSANAFVSDPIKAVMNFAEETSFYINASNIDSAKKSYAATLQVYESLNSEDKRSVHSYVNDLYNQLQALSNMSIKSTTTMITTSNSQTKDLSETDENVLSMDLPPLEPIPNTVSTSSSQSNSSSSNVASSSVQGSISKIPIANFVEDFGKAVAPSSTIPDNRFIETKPASASASSNNVPFDFSAPMNNNDIVADSKTFQADGPFTNEVDFDKLAPASDAPNMLFTVGSPSDTTVSAPVIKPIVKSVVQDKKLDKKLDVKTEAKTETVSDIKITATTAKKEIQPEAFTIMETGSLQKESPLTNSPVTISNTWDIPDTVPDILETQNLETQKSSTMSATPILAPTTASQSTPLFTPNSPLDKLDALLRKIDDDIIMEKLDKGKETYKDALMIYRSLRDSEKTLCYEHFFNTFKKLDDALHQKSLHTILEEQLLDSKKSTSTRPLAFTKPPVSEKYIPESSTIISNTTLPVIISNDLETTRVYELIEESYFNIENHNADLAMLKYFKAAELYRKLPINDKRKAYSDLYSLFQKISLAKKVRH